MKLYLAKPDLPYFEQYNDMMREWVESGTQIAPWFLDEPIETLEEFAKFVQMLDDCEHGILDKRFCSTTSYFVIDENDRLIGAASLRHHLTVDGFNTWGHIGYGIRPSERRKGCATAALAAAVPQLFARGFSAVRAGAFCENAASLRVMEKCGMTRIDLTEDIEYRGKTYRCVYCELTRP